MEASTRITQLEQEIARLNIELKREIARTRHSGKTSEVKQFDRDTKALHKSQRMSWRETFARTKPRLLITAPLIFSLIVPFALLDLWVSIYHAICFRAYGIPRVPRRDHIRIDRHQLGYLTGFQKLYCVYCGYINGLIGYVREIAARTEAFWCPIKHAGPVAQPHDHYSAFFDYGDGADYAGKLDAARGRVQRLDRDED